ERCRSSHPCHPRTVAIHKRTIEAVAKYQDPKTGVWYDIMDLPHRQGNYQEGSASSMFTYATAKGLRKGYLDKKYLKNVGKAHAGLLKVFVEEVSPTNINLNKIVAVSGLGGSKNYRDGSFEYY